MAISARACLVENEVLREAGLAWPAGGTPNLQRASSRRPPPRQSLMLNAGSARMQSAVRALFTGRCNVPARPKPRAEPLQLQLQAGLELVLAIIPMVAKTAANSKQDHTTASVSSV